MTRTRRRTRLGQSLGSFIVGVGETIEPVLARPVAGATRARTIADDGNAEQESAEEMLQEATVRYQVMLA